MRFSVDTMAPARSLEELYLEHLDGLGKKKKGGFLRKAVRTVAKKPKKRKARSPAPQPVQESAPQAEPMREESPLDVPADTNAPAGYASQPTPPPRMPVMTSPRDGHDVAAEDEPNEFSDGGDGGGSDEEAGPPAGSRSFGIRKVEVDADGSVVEDEEEDALDGFGYLTVGADSPLDRRATRLARRQRGREDRLLRRQKHDARVNAQRGRHLTLARPSVGYATCSPGQRMKRGMCVERGLTLPASRPAQKPRPVHHRRRGGLSDLDPAVQKRAMFEYKTLANRLQSQSEDVARFKPTSMDEWLKFIQDLAKQDTQFRKDYEMFVFQKTGNEEAERQLRDLILAAINRNIALMQRIPSVWELGANAVAAAWNEFVGGLKAGIQSFTAWSMSVARPALQQWYNGVVHLGKLKKDLAAAEASGKVSRDQIETQRQRIAEAQSKMDSVRSLYAGVSAGGSIDDVVRAEIGNPELGAWPVWAIVTVVCVAIIGVAVAVILTVRPLTAAIGEKGGLLIGIGAAVALIILASPKKGAKTA